ncbi:zinc ribbon domain-containing protein [Haloferax sp. Atlit-6N]|uniref:zinc ribbon domain-containing protein n=1 Tax=unclassified Haloferax TaxID=2625095 RepID=UPI000E222482|nr:MULTISPECIES: zinc ribbon domain-containing protein [unclassified Haloferax]RDZ52074.1 zinc ribbon domain-containing protein [Haloferax sp. Atlit-4N]REA01248.1 zinc ribbon domain-containing protein [Haloferax sp. Atlit-6N]
MSALTKLRPWLAAILGLIFTGFGHIYLRRWRRAAMWVLLVLAVAALFVPSGTLEALDAAETMSPSEFTSVLTELLPLLAVSFASVLDAFVIGFRQAAEAQAQAARSTVDDADDSAAAVSDPDSDAVTCPECGREVDADLDFCHWCTTRLDEPTDD